MITLPELKTGDKLRLAIEEILVGGRKAKAGSAFEEPLYRLKSPAHKKPDGFWVPAIIGTKLWTLVQLPCPKGQGLSREPKPTEVVQ